MIIIVVSVHRNTDPKETKFIYMCVEVLFAAITKIPEKKEISPGRPAFFLLCAFSDWVESECGLSKVDSWVEEWKEGRCS